jgi:hypothetical protein
MNPTETALQRVFGDSSKRKGTNMAVIRTAHADAEDRVERAWGMIKPYLRDLRITGDAPTTDTLRRVVIFVTSDELGCTMDVVITALMFSFSDLFRLFHARIQSSTPRLAEEVGTITIDVKRSLQSALERVAEGLSPRRSSTKRPM